MLSLTPAQRRLVADNLTLVRVQLRRLAPGARRARADCEHDDLFQEGVLGLIRAAQRFDSARHGAFCSFARAHIAGAVRLARAERFSTIRIPARVRRRAAAANAPHPPQPPHCPTPRSPRSAARNAAPRRATASLPAAAPDLIPRVFRLGRCARVGDPRPARPDCCDHLLLAALHQRCRAALLAAADRIAARGSPRNNQRRLVAAVLRRRLLARDPARRVSLRAAARALGCAPARIHQCEQRLLRLAAESLAADPIAARLVDLRLGRADAPPLSPRRLRRQLRGADRAAFDQHVARLDRAKLDRLLAHLARRVYGRGERLARDLFRRLDRRHRARLLMRLTARTLAVPRNRTRSANSSAARAQKPAHLGAVGHAPSSFDRSLPYGLTRMIPRAVARSSSSGSADSRMRM